MNPTIVCLIVMFSLCFVHAIDMIEDNNGAPDEELNEPGDTTESNQVQEIDVTDKQVELLAKSFTHYYQRVFLNPVSLIAQQKAVFKAKKIHLLVDYAKMTEHKFGGVEIPIREIAFEKGTSYVFAMLMKISYNSTLYAKSVPPFYHSIGAQYICAKIDKKNRCQLRSFLKVPRIQGDPSTLDANVRKAIFQKMKDDHKQHENLYDIKNYEYQEVMLSGGRLNYVNFHVKDVGGTKNCLAAVFQDASTVKILHLDDSCYLVSNLHHKKNSQLASQASSHSGSYTFPILLILCIIAAGGVYISKKKKLSGYERLKSLKIMRKQKSAGSEVMCELNENDPDLDNKSYTTSKSGIREAV